MEIFEWVIDWAIPFLIALTILIFFHELGHYWVARRNNVFVEVFSIGFGSEIYGWTDKSGTRWKISAIPLGGYVKMFGESDLPLEDDEEPPPPLTPAEQEVSFRHKTLAQRTAIVVAGPLANFLLAVILYAIVAMTFGVPRAYYAGVGQIVPGSPAAVAGFKTGDRIFRVGDRQLTWFSELVEVISVNAGVRLTIMVRRDGQELAIQATPMTVVETDEEGREVEIGRLGIRPDPKQGDFERKNPLAATWIGVQQMAGLTTNILSYLGDLITGKGKADEVGGVLRIAEFAGRTFQSGIDKFILFMAALSVNLGLINLFPIPLLDGGHLVFFAAEAVRGRPLGPRAQEYGFRFGLILVLILMVFATWNDLVHLRVIEFIKDLVT